MKLFNVLFIFLTTISCSSYRQIEFINENMTRFETKNSNLKNTVPKIFSIAMALPSRSPASIPPKSGETLNHLNNKQLYFMTLNEQYLQLGSLLKLESKLKNKCPHFHALNLKVVKKHIHHELKETSEIPGQSHYKNALNFPAFYPELSLPLDERKLTPTVYEKAKAQKDNFNFKDSLTRALKIHHRKTASELVELCETGTSDNYFIFENLNSMTNKSPLSPKKSSLDTLLKISIFSNSFILQSLKSRPFKETARPALSRIGTPWFSQYVTKIIAQRND